MDRAIKRLTLDDGAMLTIAPYVRGGKDNLKNGSTIGATYTEQGWRILASSLKLDPRSKS